MKPANRHLHLIDETDHQSIVRQAMRSITVSQHMPVMGVSTWQTHPADNRRRAGVVGQGSNIRGRIPSCQLPERRL